MTLRDFTDAEAEGYAAKTLISRNLVFMWPKDRETGEEVPTGVWNGIGNRAIPVIGGLTLVEEDRNYSAKGAMLSVGSVVMTDDLSIRQVSVSLSQLNDKVANALRGYDIRLAKIEIHRALFYKDRPRVLVAPARCRFVGFVNAAPFTTPRAGGQASVTLGCVSVTRELTRTNNDLRSDASQQRRAAGDRFHQYAAATDGIVSSWGTNKG